MNKTEWLKFVKSFNEKDFDIFQLWWIHYETIKNIKNIEKNKGLYEVKKNDDG